MMTRRECQIVLHSMGIAIDIRKLFRQWQTEKDRHTGNECYLTEDAFAAGLLIGFTKGTKC